MEKMNTWKSPDNAEASLMQEILLRKVDTDNKCLIVTETSAFFCPHYTKNILFKTQKVDSLEISARTNCVR